MAFVRALVALLLVAATCCAPAFAQDLQRLTVSQLTLSTGTNTPKVEVPFDLIVTARVRERVSELRNIDLPLLAEVELLGDEHSVVSDAGGTTYTERIRVVAHHSGIITIAPVTLDAIDARDGKAKRYSSTSLSLAVGGGLAPPGFSRTQGFAESARSVIVWAIWIALLVLLAFLFLRRRPSRSPPQLAPQPEPAPPPAPLPTFEARLRDARTVLGAERTRPAVVRVRTMVREMVGASDAETLADVLRRIDPEERPMRALLFALERAAFTHDGDLGHAIDRVIGQLDDMVGTA